MNSSVLYEKSDDYPLPASLLTRSDSIRFFLVPEIGISAARTSFHTDKIKRIAVFSFPEYFRNH